MKDWPLGCLRTLACHTACSSAFPCRRRLATSPQAGNLNVEHQTDQATSKRVLKQERNTSSNQQAAGAVIVRRRNIGPT
jgi:hypothetical protein